MARARLRAVDGVLLGLAGVVLATLVGLGIWQVQRLSWKLDLIEQVEARAYGDPIPAPSGGIPAYTRVSTQGRYLHDKTLTIKAVTDIGPGFWVMTPLVTDAQTIWVNRGFVPTALPAEEWMTPIGRQDIVGLVRVSVPHGTWLEKNDPSAGRWYSADLPIMSTSTGVTGAVPYYIDLIAATREPVWPRPGLTKLEFRNSHLAYAITWFTMALMFLGGMIFVIRERMRGQADKTA